MLKGYIYKYTYPNGKIYIGQTLVSVNVRHNQHMSASRDPRRCSLCELAIAKYGEPTLETIETIEVEDHEGKRLSKELNEAERKWIKYYDSTTNSGNGYNIKEGGRMLTPQQFLLEEKFKEVVKTEGWNEEISDVKEMLYSIGKKICVTHEKLTKAEQSIWYGYKFHEYWLDQKGRETTFNSYYKRNDPDWGDLPDEVLEIIDNESSSEEDKAWAEEIIFKNIIDEAIEEHWIKDIQHTIWDRVNKRKDNILQDFYKGLKK